MMLIKKSNISILAISIITFFSQGVFTTQAIAASSFSTNLKKIDIGEPGMQEMVVADFDGDNVDDVIISQYDSSLAGGIAAVIIHFGDSVQSNNLRDTYSLKDGTIQGDGLKFTPFGMSVGDVNADGTLDLVIAGLTNSNTKPVSQNETRIFLGNKTNPNNRFEFLLNPTKLITGGKPTDVVIGHFTDDTLLDIVIATDLGISLFKGTGIGTFSNTEIPISTLKSSIYPSRIVAKHMNNDAFLDIVSSHEILLNDNSIGNTFTRATSYGTSNTRVIKSFTVADFNGDQKNDVAYIEEQGINSELTLQLSSVVGNAVKFTRKTVATFSDSKISSIASEDIDLDGIPDIVMTAGTKTNVIYLYTGTGQGTFLTRETVVIDTGIGLAAIEVVEPALVVIMKANNDRLWDLVTANNNKAKTASLTVLLQKPGTESFVFAPKFYAVSKPLSGTSPLLVNVLRKYPATPAANTTISYIVNKGTATNGTDYIAPSGQTALDFPANISKNNISIDILATTTSTGPKNFNIDLIDANNPLAENAIVTILDDISLPTINISLQSINMFENQSFNSVVTVTRSIAAANSSLISTVLLSTELINSPANSTDATPGSDPTAAGVDYIQLTNQLITFASGEITKTIPITIIDDQIVDAGEKFRVRLTSPTNSTISNAVATVTIIENNITLPVISFATQTILLEEGLVPQNLITINRTASSFVSTVEVSTAISPTTPVAVSGVDYTALNNLAITFASGETSKTFTVDIINDAEVDPGEKFLVQLVNPTNSTILIGSATVTIKDNDQPVIILPTAVNDDSSIVDNTVSTTIMILDNDIIASAPIILNVASVIITTDPTQGTLAVSTNGVVVYTLNTSLGVPYAATDSFMYTVNDKAGNTSLPATVSITIIEAPIANADPDNTIVNNAGPKILAIVSNDSPANGIALDSVVITTPPIQGTLTFDRQTGDVIYALNSKTASGLDSFAYTIKDNTGVVSLPATVNITIIEAPIAGKDDFFILNNETSKVFPIFSNDKAFGGRTLDPASIKIITGPTNGTLGTSTANGITYTLTAAGAVSDSFTYTVDDNDGVLSPSDIATVTISIIPPTEAKPGVFSIENTSYTVSEDMGELIINVVRSSGQTGEVVVDYLLTENSAKAGLDYNDKTLPSPFAGQLTFADGVSSMPITIEILSDNDIDPNEGFSVSLTMVSAGVILSPAPVIVTIIDSTAKPGIFSFDVKNSYTVAEENEELIINVTRSMGSTGEVTLTYLIQDNTATLGTDFDDVTQSSQPNELVFADGVLTMPITIAVFKDTEIESAEDFLISLTAVIGGVIANENTSNVVTITDSTEIETPPITINSVSSGGGGCTLQSTARFDPSLPFMLMFALFFFGRRKILKAK